MPMAGVEPGMPGQQASSLATVPHTIKKFWVLKFELFGAKTGYTDSAIKNAA